MKFTNVITAGCLAAAVSASGLFAQEEPVEVRIRAIQKDGKVEVVEERVTTPEAKPAEPKAGIEEEGIRARVIRRLQSVAGKAGKTGVVVEEALDELPSSDFWIGVQLAPVPPEVQKHLAVKHGILILSVYDDSPAAKAGFLVDDILLQTGDAKIETPTDLIKAVDAAKTTELKFTILREGKEQSIAVTPIKRAELALTLTRPETEAGTRTDRLQAAQRQFEKALETLRVETAEEGAVDFMLVRPGAFLSRAAAEMMAPDDLTIQITKQGNKQTRVHVREGDKTWDVAAYQLEELPKEIRPFVEQMMGSGGGAATVALAGPDGRMTMKVAPPGKPVIVTAPQMVMPFHPGMPAVPAVPATPATAVPPRMVWSAASTAPAGASDAKLDQILKKLETLTDPDLDEMKKELKALRKEVEELRSKSK